MALVPLYRLQGHGDHFYTTSADERDNAVSQYGYANEGIACYVSTTPDAQPDAMTLRDALAVAALTALIDADIRELGSHRPVAVCTARAYEYADAMLVARKT